MSFRRVIESCKNYFRPQTVDEAMERKELFSKLYAISCAILFGYTVFKITDVNPSPKDTRLFPDWVYELAAKSPIQLYTVKELEKLSREKKLKEMEELKRKEESEELGGKESVKVAA